MGPIPASSTMGIQNDQHGSTKAIPFSLVYGAEAMIPAEVLVPSTRMIMGMREKERKARN
ncbi:hypothetical protein SESBI_26530 [Sesbania bispinosa]|nr:hypothetical protein SESBI_26530 [Sesbania bispinosa]